MDDELRIAICEDLEQDQNLLLSRIRETGIPAHCETFTSGEAFLHKFKAGLYHLVYLDIYMEKLTGMQTAAAIRELDGDVTLAFTTTSRDHAFESNKYRSLLYIEKPVSPEMIAHTLNLAAALRDKSKSQVLTIPIDGGRIDIKHNDLVFIEVYDHRCILHLWDGRIVSATTSTSIDDLEALLPTPQFCRTHRSYIVNLDMVKRPNDSDFEMKNGEIAYVTQKERRRIFKQYDEWLFKRVMDEQL
ncbi:MAG: LytTR family DNA-binding domain-containing protein [Clostridium sp.]|nr:LytTR family DNA-binding domain-containing protein [Clostridium sp.]